MTPITIRLCFAKGDWLTVEGQRASWRWWERLLGKPLIVSVRAIDHGTDDDTTAR